MAGMMLWMVAFWALLIVGGSWLGFTLFRRERVERTGNLLQERRGRGEIELDDFNSRMAALAVSDPSRTRWRIGGALDVALIALAVVAVAMVASMDWGMSSMHRGGRDTSGDAQISGSLDETIRVEDFAFRPGNLQVPVGARVTWSNQDSAPHDATARNADWKTGRLSRGESTSLTFDESGVFEFYCSIHPQMKARLSVQD